MAESMRFYIPITEYAKSMTDIAYFPDKANLALNFDTLNWETGIPDGSNLCIIRVDADSRASSGSLSSGIEFACISVRNWPQYFSSGKQVVFKSTTSPSFTGLVTRGTVTFLTAGGNLLLSAFNSTTDRYWQIELQNLSGVAPQVELVMLGVIGDIQARWNWNGPVVRDDLTICELLPGRSFFGRRVRAYASNDFRRFNIETRRWEFADDTDATTIKNIFDLTGGPLLPFVIKDYNHTFMYQWRLVRFDPETHGNRRGLIVTPVASGYNDFSFTFCDLPRIFYGNTL